MSDDEEGPPKKKKDKKDKKDKKKKDKKDKKLDGGASTVSLDDEGSVASLDAAASVDSLLDDGSSTELSPRPDYESSPRPTSAAEGDDGGKKKKKDKKKKKKGDAAESVDDGGSVASLDAAASFESLLDDGPSTESSPRPTSAADGDDGGKKKKKDKKKKKKDKSGDDAESAHVIEEKPSAPEPATFSDAPVETPRTMERNFENALSENLKALGVNVTDRPGGETEPTADVQGISSSTPASPAPAVLGPVSPQSDPAQVPSAAPASESVTHASGTTSPSESPRLIPADTDASVARSATLSDDSETTAPTAAIAAPTIEMPTEIMTQATAVSPETMNGSSINEGEGIKRRKNSFKGKQPSAEMLAAIESDIKEQRRGITSDGQFPTMSIAQAKAAAAARAKETEEAKARSLKLRADARARRAAEVASRKDAENSRLKYLDAAAESVLSIQNVLAEGTIGGLSLEQLSPTRSSLGTLNAKKYPISAARGIIGGLSPAHGDPSLSPSSKALTHPHPPAELPPPSYLLRPSVKGSDYARASNMPTTSPHKNTQLATAFASEHSQEAETRDQQLDYHMLQVNAMTEDLTAAAHAAAAAAAAIARRAAAMQSPRGPSASPPDKYSPSHASLHNPLLVSSAVSSSPIRAIKFTLPENDPLLNYSPSKFKSSGGSAVVGGKLVRTDRNSYDGLPKYEGQLPTIGSRSASGESGGKKVWDPKQKPLWQRLQEKQQKQDADEERKRNEDYIRYKIERAKAQPSKEEIEEHMRLHDELASQKYSSKLGSERRLLRGAVNNDPFDLVYKKTEYLAAEERLLIESRQTRIKKREDVRAGSPLKTKANSRAIEAIERRKDQEFLAAEEKRIRLQRKRDFSEQVRDTFLPTSSIPVPPAIKQRSDGGRRIPVTDNKHVKWAPPDREAGYGYGEAGGNIPHKSSSMQRSRVGSQDEWDARRMKKPTIDAHKAQDSRSVKTGPEWIAQVLESDPGEKQMKDVYEIAFSTFFDQQGGSRR